MRASWIIASETFPWVERKIGQLIQRSQGGFEIERHGCCQGHFLLLKRVKKLQFPGMKHLPRCSIARVLLQPLVLTPAVSGVPHQWEAGVVKMDPDLVSAPGMQARFYQCRLPYPLHQTVGRMGHAPPLHYGHPFAMSCVPTDGGFDFSPKQIKLSAHQGQVNLFNLSFGELAGERLVRLIILGHHQATAGILIQAMHNSRPKDAANPTEPTGAMVEQGVDQRVILMAGRWMNHQSRRLVDYQQTVVFKQNIQRDGLWLR